MREDQYPDTFPRPVSDPEADGLPDTADDDSTAYDDDSSRAADGPDPASLPGDEPIGVDRFGVTAEESRVGESLDYKLGREQPDADGDRPTPTPSEGDDVDTIDDTTDRPDPDAGLVDASASADPDSPVSVYDVPDTGLDAGAPIGRLVEPDEGAHVDDEPDAIAWDAGPAGGGASAEELAMHEVPEP
jgi:hypothetical protein